MTATRTELMAEASILSLELHRISMKIDSLTEATTEASVRFQSLRDMIEDSEEFED